MMMREVIGLGFGFLVLAGLSMAIVNGGNTASVLTAFSNGFADVIRASTLQAR